MEYIGRNAVDSQVGGLTFRSLMSWESDRGWKGCPRGKGGKNMFSASDGGAEIEEVMRVRERERETGPQIIYYSIVSREFAYVATSRSRDKAPLVLLV